MKKRVVLLFLCAMMLLSSCAKSDNTKDIEKSTTVNAQDGTTQSSNNNDNSASDSITAPQETQTPAPIPSPTPFPVDEVQEYDNYGFTYKEKTPLLNEPNDQSFVHAQLEKDSQLHLIGKYDDGKWLLVDYNGTTGYIKHSSVALSKGYINADDVKLREGSSRSKDIKQILNQQTELFVIGRYDNEWYKVVLMDGNDTLGYVFCDYVSYYDAYVSAEDVRLREAPNVESKTVTRIEKGKRMSIICEYNGWYKVNVGEFTGYMSADFVEYSASVKKIEKTRAYLLDSGVNFREGPSTNCASMGKLAKYAPVYITGETDEWFRVIYNETEGYISKDFVREGKLVVYVNSQDVNLRSGPGTGYDLLTKVRKNSIFEITGADGDWLKGVVNHNTGYIRSDYLTEDSKNAGDIGHEFTEAEIDLAAKVVYLEAKGRGTEAYRAVANVIYNRVKSHRFPNTVKGVVWQEGQFSVTRYSSFNSTRPSSEAYNATKDVLNKGIRPLPFNVLFFHVVHAGTSWGSEKKYYKTIGDNAFFRYVG